MNKSKKIKISIMEVLLIVTSFTGTFIRIKSCELHIRQVYWSTSDISETVETKDYIITKNKNYYVNQKENDLKYKLIPEIDEGNKSVTNLVGSSESNIVYFLESKDNVNYIVEKSLDTYEEKIIYKSKNYDESVKLFGIDIIHNYDNVITKTDNYIMGFLIMNNKIVIRKQGLVTIYDGITEKTIISEKVNAIYNFDDYIFYTNGIGELYYMNVNDYKTYKADDIYAKKIRGIEGGVMYEDIFTNKWMKYSLY